MKAAVTPDALIRARVRLMQAYAPGEQHLDCIKLNTNECAWDASPAVLAAAHLTTAEQLRLYPQPRADRLRAAAAGVYGLQPEQILAGNGSDDCLTILFRAHLEADDLVACPWPTYSLYDTLAELQGVRMRHLPFTADWQLPSALASTDAKLTFVANPNNPSATMLPLQALRELADTLRGILVVDEAYIDFASPQAGYGSALSLLESCPNLVVLRTFSKSYSLAGARLGLLFAHPALVENYFKVKDSYNVGALTQALGIAALADVEHHRQVISRTLSERHRLQSAFAERGWTWPSSQANFLLCRVGPKAGALYRALKERGVLVRHFDRPGLSEHLRITVGTPVQNTLLLDHLAELGA